MACRKVLLSIVQLKQLKYILRSPSFSSRTLSAACLASENRAKSADFASQGQNQQQNAPSKANSVAELSTSGTRNEGSRIFGPLLRSKVHQDWSRLSTQVRSSGIGLPTMHTRGVAGGGQGGAEGGQPPEEGDAEEEEEFSEEAMSYDNINVEVLEAEKVGIITINRPQALNALNEGTMYEVVDALMEFETDPGIGAVILTGEGPKAFAAGADIKEMQDKTFVEAYSNEMLAAWEQVEHFRKPIIAAVNGYALGGGCELAMMCDIILAGEKAIFGQPEVTLGTIPGMGGTQRLIRAVGKSRAMEMILSGSQFMTAQEAVARGLAARVVPGDRTALLSAAVDLAKKMTALSPVVVRMAKEAVKAAHETTLQEGLKFERNLFYSTFSLEDQKEGMRAFVEKRKPKFQGS